MNTLPIEQRIAILNSIIIHDGIVRGFTIMTHKTSVRMTTLADDTKEYMKLLSEESIWVLNEKET